jgi:hypothetical protein
MRTDAHGFNQCEPKRLLQGLNKLFQAHSTFARKVQNVGSRFATVDQGASGIVCVSYMGSPRGGEKSAE